MQKRILIFTFTLCAALLFIGLFPVHGEAEVYESVVRLHVLANSDSEEDQALKLKVRDAVLEVTVPLLSDCTDREEAESILTQHSEEIRLSSLQVLEAEGRADDVTVVLGEESYPTRD